MNFRPSLLIFAASFFVSIGLNRAAETDAGKEAVVELPEFKVTDGQVLPEPEKWRYAEIPGFEILTNASDGTTKRLIKDFSEFRQALNLVWPSLERSVPYASLILCGKKSRFQAFAPVGQSKLDAGRASLFLKNREQTSIVVDLQSKVVNVGESASDDADSGTDSSQVVVDHSKQLYREYVRYLLSQNEPRLPPWYEEGMAQIVMAMRFTPTVVEFGKIEDPNAVSIQSEMNRQINEGLGEDGIPLGGAPAEDVDFNAALKRKALIPMDKFFAVTRDAPEASNPLGNNRWAKQAYAFVHLCLYGENQRYNKAFTKLLLRSASAPITEAMFKECFNMSYRDMLMEIRGYIDFTNYKSQEYRIKGAGLPPPPNFTLRDATQAEVGRVKGAALVAAGNDDKARLELIAPYVRGERDPRLLAELGLYERKEGHDDRAHKFLQAAVTGKVVWPRAYYELSRLRLEAIQRGDGALATLTPAQTEVVLAPLLIARNQPPHLPEVYELIGQTWARSSAKPKPDDAKVLIEGAMLFQGRLGLVYMAAQQSVAAGVDDAAKSLIDYGLKVSPNPTAKARFEELKSALASSPAKGR